MRLTVFSDDSLRVLIYLAVEPGRRATIAGSLALARPPHGIRIGEIVRQSEGSDAPARCFGDEPDRCAIVRLRRLREALGEAVGASYEPLDRHTLADVVQDRTPYAAVLLSSRAASKRRSMKRWNP
jgi:Rrf2 family nitric oxide-sensitive transcriptional repressor